MDNERENIKDLAYKDYINGVKYKDIADRYKVSLSTIKSWASRYWNCKKVANQNKQKIKSKVYKNISIDAKENNKLTEKQKLFCMYYIDNFNATQAYLKAYDCSYSTAKVEGCKSLTNPNILRELKMLKELKKETLLIDEQDILERYIHIAFADMNDFVDFGVNKIKTINEQGIEEEHKLNHVNFKDSNIVDGGLICEISVGKNGSKIKLEDRLKALDWLSKYFNMNPIDKHKIEYDNKRFELEQQKINKSESEIADDWVDVIIESDRE